MRGISSDGIFALAQLPIPFLEFDFDCNLIGMNEMGASILDTTKNTASEQNKMLFDLAKRCVISNRPLFAYGVTMRSKLGADYHVDVVVDLQDHKVIMCLFPKSDNDIMHGADTHEYTTKSISGLAQMLSHEIRNPLAGISGAAQLLSDTVSPVDVELTDLIMTETTRIGHLVDRFERFGDAQPEQYQLVNIHDVLTRAKRAAQAGFARDIVIAEEYDPSLPEIMGDPDQLLQVIVNLMKNASEAMHDHTGHRGEITLKTAYHHGKRIKDKTGKLHDMPIQVQISDNGVGVPKDLMPDIYNAFVSSKINGTGLGLALVAKIMTEHGGNVSCVSKVGETQFLLWFPFKK